MTSFRRAEHLARAIDSVRAAGVRRVTIALVEPTPAVRREVLARAGGWLSFDVSETPVDIGCNETWLAALYQARTKRVIVLHDDDCLTADFGEAYRLQLAPQLSSGVGFASWRACLLYEDGSRRATEHTSLRTGVYPSTHLAPVVATPGRLSLSPIISVLDRQTVIAACKEADATLRHPDCLLHPGMLIGTEILVYLRTIQRNQLWFHLDRVLSMYGSHLGSGTIRAEQGLDGGMLRLTVGYDRARAQGRLQAPPARPKIILATWGRKISALEERQRVALARESRVFLQGTAEAIGIELEATAGIRTMERPNGGTIPYLRDVLDAACARAMPEDAVVYVNDDVGLVIDAPARILAGLDRGRGVTVLPRHLHRRPRALLRTLHNCPLDGGVDAVAVTPAWWAAHRDKVPDFLIGTDAWDTVFRVIAEEWADGGGLRETVETDPENWRRSRAYTPDVCWHVPHHSRWIRERQAGGRRDQAGQHNRQLAREFFADRANQDGLKLLADSEARRRR